jgi:hypothetical protein
MYPFKSRGKQMNKQIGIVAGVMVLLLLGTAAWAQGGQGRRGGGPGGDGQGREGQHERPAFGSIISISAESIVIRPELPPEMAERRQEKGRDMPELPEQISLKLTADTKFAFDGGMGSISDFKAGDYVVVRQKDGTAIVVSDKASAKQFMEGRQERRGEGGQGGQAGPGGPGGERRPPAMGSITAISADSITIKPQIPEEMRKRMEENGRPLPELPASITWSIDSETRFMQNGEKVDSNPFKTGDIVVVMGPPDDGSAKAIIDEATARQKMEERGGQGGPGREGKGQGKGRRQPK